MAAIKGVHALAEIFPLLGEKEFEDLVTSIKNNGLQQSIVTDSNGMLLDGRNRRNACEKLGIEPETVIHDGDALTFILNANVRRRHLNESQRALIAAVLANMAVGRPQTNSANLPNNVISQKDAAALLNISPRSVGAAKQVLDGGDADLVERVKNGNIAVYKAIKLVRSTAEEAKRKVVCPEPANETYDAKKPPPLDATLSDPAKTQSSADVANDNNAIESTTAYAPADKEIDVHNTAVRRFSPSLEGVDVGIAVIAAIEKYGLQEVLEVIERCGDAEINSLKHKLRAAESSVQSSEESPCGPDKVLREFMNVLLMEAGIDHRAVANELLSHGILQKDYVAGKRPPGQ